jgi:tRNA pseudouridine38-40 synthase
MAARRLVGRHDFRSFAAQRHYEVESTIRTVTRCQVGREGPLVTIRVRAEGFLYKMCRSIAGTLVQVGQGKIPPQEVARILGQRDRRAAGMTAPAHGLVLWKVRYPRGQARAPRARRPSVQPTPD